MRFKYSSVSVAIAGSFVLPIHAILSFTRLAVASTPTQTPPTPQTRSSRRPSTAPRLDAPRHEFSAIHPPAPAPASDETAPRPPGSVPKPLPAVPAKPRAASSILPQPRRSRHSAAPLISFLAGQSETDLALP